MVEGKECSRCGEWKPRTEFYKEKLGKYGLRSKCIECMSSYTRTRRKTHREEVLATEAAWREKNRESIRERQSRWERENLEHVRQLQQEWREDNREWLNEYARNRYRDNPRYQEKARSDGDKRRARERDLPYETLDRWDIFERDGWTCGICDDRIPLVVVWPHPHSASVDHVVPLSHPESPGHVWTNVQASHLTCNLRKHNKCETPKK